MTDDREQVAALLGRHYVEERFDADELSRRLDIAYTGADANAALDGLPTLPPHIGKERRRWGRRHGEAGTAQPGWMPTKERFVDPGTQRIMRVWVDPADHSRTTSQKRVEPPRGGRLVITSYRPLPRAT